MMGKTVVYSRIKGRFYYQNSIMESKDYTTASMTNNRSFLKIVLSQTILKEDF